MSSGSKRPRSYADSSDNLGVTELKEDPVYTFRWNIKNFNERLQSTEPMDLASPVFRDFNDEIKGLQWQLKLKRRIYRLSKSEDYFNGYLYLVNYTKATAVKLQFNLLNSEKSYKTVTKDHEFTSSTDECVLFEFVKTATLLDPENKLLEDDTLKINCRITIEHLDKNKKVKDKNRESETHAATRKSYFVSDITNLFNSSTLSDVCIKTKSTTLRAHKTILSCRSPIFSGMFQTKVPESVNNTVDILDFNHDVVNTMLKYIYGGEIPQDFLLANCSAMLGIAVKYGIKGLKEDAGECIARYLSLENVVDYLIYADKYEIQNLKSRAVTFFNMNKAQLIESGGTQKIMDYKPTLLLELYQTY